MQLLCIGSVLWDMIGRSPDAMQVGSDVAGRITRLPGGVALNIAMTSVKFGLRPVLLSAVGEDRPGEELLDLCEEMGLETRHVHRAAGLPTDRYMAIEGANGVIAAIADAHSLEASGAEILTPLANGAIATEASPYAGLAALDGNLTPALLSEIAHGTLLRAADLRIAPASPGKAARLEPFIATGRGTLYVNREEAGILCQTDFPTAQEAAMALVSAGAMRAIVTDSGQPAADATKASVVTGDPTSVRVVRLTGAGDTFMAAHIAAEARGKDRQAALMEALGAAATYVSGDDA
jgi:sugar/nucleoside kinase (ribokinase family)